MNKREYRLMEGLSWSRVPTAFAVRFAARPGPFKAVRRIPLSILVKLMAAQVAVVSNFV
jgi:hypothetical protein